MKFFSGFCFQNEEELFAPFAQIDQLYTISGFSYGAIKAFQASIQATQSHQRIQTLNLFSPAFFQTQKPSFIKAQILGFRKDPQRYRQNFLSLCGSPPQKYFKEGCLEELEELLHFQWKEEELRYLNRNGVKIRVFLGEKDSIIPAKEACDFFSPFGNVFLYKNLNHCLQCDHL